MNKIQAPRGTHDVIQEDSLIWQFLEINSRELFNSYGFSEIRTPIFEATELFSRAVGEDSDIVNKEMYTFADRSDRSLTLRPEGTAGVVRSFVENNLDRSSKPVKFWYQGPMFRYERPQTGRYRQFHQIGVEALGSSAPYIDLELIELGIKLLNAIGLDDLTLYANSIGNHTSRKAYTEALKNFLKGLQSQVCDDCKRRFEQNPLRCLDCKVPEDQKLYAQAPLIHEFFDDESQLIWEQIQTGLKELNIKFVFDPKLVRGLDYYNHCVFEIKTQSAKLGMQSTVLAGGRYDNLVSMLGGAETPACGWALGEERLVELLKEKNLGTKQNNKIFILADNGLAALKLAGKLRQDLPQCSIELDYDGAKFKKQLEKAIKKNNTWVIFYMEDERLSGKFKIKNLKKTEEIDNLTYQAMIDLIRREQIW